MSAQQYQPIDLRVTSDTAIPNPFYVQITGVFTSESGAELTIPGFYDGDNTWAVRFSPTELGRWTWSITCNEHEQLTDEGVLTCVGNSNDAIHGGLEVNPESSRYFRYADGADYYMMGAEIDWLFALYMKDRDEARAFLDKLAGYHFNSVIMNVYAHECSWSDKTAPGLITPPPLYPWAGDNAHPDHARLNPAFFQEYDALMDDLLQRGITAHLFLYVYNKSVNWPKKGTPEDALYLDYLVARYQAYPNVIWDYAKETYYQNDKDYLYAMLRRIREKDAYQRLLTVHDDKLFCADPERATILDFISLQYHQDFHTVPQIEYMHHHCPIVNTEYGYECGPGGIDDITYGEGNTAADFMHRTYNVAMGGGSIVHYYTYTAWDIIRPEDTPPGYAALKAFYELFTSLPWWRYEPRPDLCIWTPTACFAEEDTGNYLLKVNDHGRFLMDKDFSKLNVKGIWMHIVSGETRDLTADHYGPHPVSPTMTVLSGPFRRSSVLLLHLEEEG